MGYLHHTNSLLDIATNVQQLVANKFEAKWKTHSGYKAGNWEYKHALSATDAGSATFNLAGYASMEELLDMGGDVLKRELTMLGLKCGNTPLNRAKHL